MGGSSKILMLLATPFPRPNALRRVYHSGLPLAALSSAAITTSSSRSRRLLLSSTSCPSLGFSIRSVEQVHTQATGARDGYGEAAVVSALSSRTAHPWPEWSKLVEYVASGGYTNRQGSVAVGVDDDDDFPLEVETLTEEFVMAAEACLSFARNRPDLLRSLEKKDIQMIVENGSPFLFKNGKISTSRLRSFLSGDETNVLGSERAGTVDIMRYLLSCAWKSHSTQDDRYLHSGEAIETSARKLLAELVNISITSSGSRLTEFPSRQHQEYSRPTGQNVEMKRGDWICPKCSFMNFARNMRCLECSEARPKRVLTGGEWECPQCDFFNYGRNISCLRCDCRRPSQSPQSTASSHGGSGYTRSSSVEILNGSNIDKSEIELKLAANDEKAERWFSKMSQLDSTADMSSAIADEDFPEIMPMRKGENRFVVSTRKTPLERRLANARNNFDVSNSGSSERNCSQPGGSSEMQSENPSESSISQSLDRILGRTSASSGMNNQASSGAINSGTGTRFNSSDYRQRMANQKRDPDYVPFVPLAADMFSKSHNGSNEQYLKQEGSASMSANELSRSWNPTENNNHESSSVDAERWSKKVAEVDKGTDGTSAISDEDFPDIMPMRKGENRFVISKKKDRSLKSPQYKRRIAMEQANSSNFVPFVPFPPGYFAKKDKVPEASAAVESAAQGPISQVKAGLPENFEEFKSRGSYVGIEDNVSRQPDVQPTNQLNTGASNTTSSAEDIDGTKTHAAHDGVSGYSSGLPSNSWNSQNQTWNDVQSNNATSATVNFRQPENSKSSSEGWKPNFTAKSLEGSAVSKEPDPLDMSQEAKEARWYRRISQIKDISELANIPDEDFPDIMPMRKGVNRFVVSKRKTPLERRLTSPQYRRNLPIVSSEPEKDAS